MFVGLGEGVASSAATDIIARSVSVGECLCVVGFVFSGFNIGLVFGLGVVLLLIEVMNWRMVFVFFGLCGLVWSFWVWKLYGDGGMVDESYKDDGVMGLMGKCIFIVDVKVIVSGKSLVEDFLVLWGEFISNSSVRAFMYVYFCNNWGFYVLFVWFLMYFIDEFGVILMNVLLLILFLLFVNVVMVFVVGSIADRFIGSGMEIMKVCKMM